MDYTKMIREDIFRGIDDTLYVVMLQAGDRAAVDADIMGSIIKREIGRYTDNAVRRVKAALKGGNDHD